MVCVAPPIRPVKAQFVRRDREAKADERDNRHAEIDNGRAVLETREPKRLHEGEELNLSHAWSD